MNLSRDIERLQISITGLARILAQSYKTLAASLPMAGVYMCNLLGVLYANTEELSKILTWSKSITSLGGKLIILTMLSPWYWNARKVSDYLS